MDEKEVKVLVWKKMIIVFLALVGFLTTIKLAMIYYDSNFNPYALPSFCSLSDFVDCDGVAHTTHSQFLGIPLAYWGMGLYVFMVFLVFVDKLKKIKFLGFLEVFKNPFSYISALGFISFAISMILAGISIFEIKKICILCVCTYLLNLLIAMVATDFKLGFLQSFQISFTDFVDALKEKKYLISFICVAIFGSAVLAYTALSYCFTPQVKKYKEFQKYEKMQNDNPYKVSGNVLGDKDAKITVYLYTDYRCPICRVYNIIIYRVATELSGFKITHKNLPLDSACNKKVLSSFHEGACMLAKYSIAAEKQGRFWELNSAFFDKEPKTEDDIIKLAKSIGFDSVKLKKDANSLETKKELNEDIDSAIDLRIDGTPSLVINGKIYTGVKPYYELKDILLKVGAVERKE